MPRKWTVNSGQWITKRLLQPGLLLFTVHCALSTALSATHVTATYDLGANPRVMATVNGTPQYGLVFAQRNKLVTYGDVEYGPSVVKGYLNASGQLNDGAGNLWLDLIPNLGATPGDSYYVLTLNIQGRVHAEIWVVPDVASVSAEVCRQAQPPSSTSPALFYQFLQQDGDDLPQRQKLNFTGAGVNCVDNAGQLRTDCAISGGGGSVPKASAITSGTVKTDTTESDPVVYLKSSADSLLAAKAPLGHSHAESDVTNLVTDLAGKVASTRAVNTTAPLSGGGALSSDLTLSLPAASGSQNGYLTSADWTTFNSKESALSFNAPLNRSLNTISIPQASGSQNGYLASGDWTTFNNKVSTSRSISTTAPLQGGGNLSADRTLSINLFGSSPGTKVVSTSLAGDPSADNCVKWLAGGKLGDAGAACGAGGGAHNILSSTHSDTSAASAVLGDLIGANSTPLWQRLAGNTTTTKKFLTQTGTGSVSALPAWGTIADADIPSTIVRTSRQISTTSPLSGGGTLASDLTLTCPTCEVTGNKNAANGYAGLTASTKLNVAQGQEVWGLADLSDVSGTSGSGSTAILSTLTGLAASDLLKWSGSNWVNTSSIPESQVTNLTTDLAGKVPTSRNVNTSSPLGGGGALSSDLTLTCTTCEVTGNKNAASGYAGLTSGTKLAASQGQEVWSVSDLTDYSTTSGSGSTALKATITSPSSNDVLTWNGSTWINQAPSGGSSHNLLSSTHTDTDAGSAVLGDIISGNSTPHWQRVAGNTTSTKKFLTQTGTGSASALPTWGTIADADIPNTIARTASPTLTGTVTVNGVVSQITTDSGTADLYAVNTWAASTHTSGTQTQVVGVAGNAGHSGAGGTTSVLTGVGGYAELDGGTVGTMASLEAYSNYISGSATNNYGVYVQPQSGASNNYAVYTEGTTPSRFGGFVNAVGGFKVNSAATNHSVLLGNGTIYQGSGAIPDCQDAGGNHLNYTQSTKAFSCGTTGGSGSSAWSSLTNAGAALTLANGDWATTFNQTSAVNWTWANTTAATSGAPQSSPLLKLSGQYWNGSATAEDYWTLQDVIGTGTNGASTLAFAHSGSSGTYVVSVPATFTASNIRLGTGTMRTTGAADGLNVYSGTGSDSNGNRGTLSVYGGDTGGTSLAGGALVLRGGNSTATGTGSGGNLTISAGYANGAAAQTQGQLYIKQAFLKGTTVTANNVVCLSSSNTVDDCAISATDVVGVADTVNTYSALVSTYGTHTVNFDGTYSPSANWFACTSASTAGTVMPQSSACAAGRQVGMITASGTNITSGAIDIRRTASVTGGGGGGDNISVNGSAAADADFDDSTPAAPSNAINVKWLKDASTPNNLSAYVPYASPLTVTGGNLTVGSDSIGPTQIDETASYSFSGTLGIPVKADPGSPTVGEIWVNEWAFRYRDNSGTPVTRTVEVMSNKNAASGYAGLTASTKLNASQGQEVWALSDLSDVAISSPSSGQVPRYDGSGWVNSALACTDVTNCPSLVAAGSAGISAYNAGAAATAARSDHTHRVIRTMQWHFPGTVVAGVQTARSLVPEGVSNCALTNSRLTAGTVGGTATTWNIQRCTTAAGDCTATADIYSGNITLNASTQSVAGGTPNTTTATAGDAFRVNLASVGTNLADATVALSYTCENTN